MREKLNVKIHKEGIELNEDDCDDMSAIFSDAEKTTTQLPREHWYSGSSRSPTMHLRTRGRSGGIHLCFKPQIPIVICISSSEWIYRITIRMDFA